MARTTISSLCPHCQNAGDEHNYGANENIISCAMQAGEFSVTPSRITDIRVVVGTTGKRGMVNHPHHNDI
jgi:hypothetical protein